MKYVDDRDKRSHDSQQMMSATLSRAKTGTAVMCERINGAQGRNRTTDTAIFSHVYPYFLSP